jgi:cytoskeletal protein CcmA (bactofilin family)
MGMFEKKSEKSPATPPPPPGGLSIIAVGMTVRGDIDSNGTVKVEGTVDGNVFTRNQVLVAKGGVVRGDLEARECVVGGSVYGAIIATERVEVQPGATVHGDVTTRKIAIAEGASLNGLIRMSETNAEPAPIPRTETRPSLPPPPMPAVRPSVPVAKVAIPPRQGASYP